MKISPELQCAILRHLPLETVVSWSDWLGLNLHSLFYPYRLDLCGFSEKIFDEFCRNVLPRMETAIHTLCLSDDDRTPHQSELFLEYHFQLVQFTRLHTLNLFGIHSAQILKKLMIEWADLPELKVLGLIQCYIENEDLDCRTIMNSIWIVQRLDECHFDVSFKHEMYLNSPTVESTSLKRLTIEGINCRSSELNRLLERTRNLEYIFVKIDDDGAVDESLSIPRSMHTFELRLGQSTQTITNLFRTTSDLRILRVRSSYVYLDGRQWKEMVVNYLPKLVDLQFQMRFRSDTEDKRQQFDNLVETFKSSFWMEHKWYVRFHLLLETEQCHIDYYTIPYAFADLSFPANSLCESTTAYFTDYWVYNNVVDLSYYKLSEIGNSVCPHVSFPTVHHLCISKSFDDQLCSTVPNLSELKSLIVMKDVSRTTVQDLLDQATKLRSLTLFVCMLDLKNSSVRQLDLTGCGYLTSEQCHLLWNSELGKQCQVFSVKVKYESDISVLLKELSNLRALRFQYRDDIVTSDRLLESLRLHWPFCRIGRDPKNKYYIRIWISSSP